MVTVGASEGIDLALRAIVNPGDEVLVPDPSYVSYAPGVRFSHGVCRARAHPGRKMASGITART